MGRPPAFPLYAGDFLSDANQMAMTLAEAGAYIRLMCVCWKEGSIPDNPKTLWKLAQAQSLRAFERVWPNVRVCFEERDDGCLVHPRIEQERRKKDAYRQKMSESGKKGAAKRYDKTELSRDEPNQAIATLGPGHGIRDEREKEVAVETEKDAFQEFWEAYPKRSGANPRNTAFERWRSNRKRGVSASKMLDAAKRYAVFMRATEQIGTQFVSTAVVWLGKNEGWDETWEVTESDRAKTEEVHPSVQFNRKWAKRAEALDGEDDGSLEPVGGMAKEIVSRIKEGAA